MLVLFNTVVRAKDSLFFSMNIHPFFSGMFLLSTGESILLNLGIRFSDPKTLTCLGLKTYHFWKVKERLFSFKLRKSIQITQPLKNLNLPQDVSQK